ncbi:MAG: glutamine amidotransferase [Acidobacteriales bacterium 59-55]|nr:glutamine amidotransferase [Terriglobales bacterium]ODU55823.1 MAG: glutamine amidotransferase [Granulicella sp. SCN 62-9]OJV42289.1 MAG: glutamine amidotransferase [Acidobacteriales bacterium 59-55]
MKTAFAIRHVHFEDLGTLEPLLRQRGYEVRYHDVGLDDFNSVDAESPSLIVVLGAPIGAYDEAAYPFLTDELNLIRERLAARRPLLGICLGAQLMARALGAAVAPMGHKEIGFSPLTLTAAGKDSPLAALVDDQPVLHWHGDQFAIPDGLESLATTPLCPHQAFAVGEYALGLQFHLEADTRRIEQWLVGHAGELAQAGVDPVALRAAAQACGPRLEAASQAVFAAWLDRIE